MAGPYGTQIVSRPGQIAPGYAHGGGVYDPSNPVYYTQGGLRPGNAAGVGGNAPANGPFAQPAYQNAPQVPYAWTAAGKRLASMEQQQYGRDFYGNPGATGGLAGAIANGGAGGTTGNVSTGINFQLPNLSSFRNALYNPAARQPGLSLAQQGELGNQYANMFAPMVQRADLDLARGGAEQLAGLQRQFQVGRANAGLGWANLGQRINEIGMDDILGQQGLQTDRLSLIARIIGAN